MGAAFVSVLAFAATPPAAPGVELELVLPANADRSPPAEFLLGLASSGLVPREDVRRARRREGPGLFLRVRPGLRRAEADVRLAGAAQAGELRLAPGAAKAVEALGLRELALQLFPGEEALHLVAAVSLGPVAPVPPLRNAPLRPPSPTRAGGAPAWAVAAVSLEPERIVPWTVAVAERMDRFQGTLLRDGLEVVKLNLGLDVGRDLLGTFRGEVRARASCADSIDGAEFAADLRSAGALRGALRRLAAASRVLGKRGPGLTPARFGDCEGFRVRLPLEGARPALAFAGDTLVGETHPRSIDVEGGKARELARRLQPAARHELPRALAGVGPADRCAVLVFDVVEAARAARRIARALGLDEGLLPDPEKLGWADGEAAFVARAGGAGLEVWGAWVRRRSVPGLGPGSPVAEARPADGRPRRGVAASASRREPPGEPQGRMR